MAGTDTSYGELNKSVLKNSYHETGINDITITQALSSVTNILAVNIPAEKYNVPPFPTLSKLNEELRGYFDITSTNKYTLQPGSEVHTIPSLLARQSINLSINNTVCLQDTIEGHLELLDSLMLSSHLSELMEKIVNPNISSFFHQLSN